MDYKLQDALTGKVQQLNKHDLHSQEKVLHVFISDCQFLLKLTCEVIFFLTYVKTLLCDNAVEQFKHTTQLLLLCTSKHLVTFDNKFKLCDDVRDVYSYCSSA